LYDRSGDPTKYARILVNNTSVLSPYILCGSDEINIGTRIFVFKEADELKRPKEHPPVLEIREVTCSLSNLKI
jgi:hypothetical protein